MSILTKEYGAQIWRNEAGELHREDGPAWIDAKGTERWFFNNRLHREDGPAITWWNGAKGWYRHGNLHCDYGPAYIENGSIEWRINHAEITDRVHEWMKEMSIEPDYTKWTDKEKLWFKLRFCGT